MLANEQINYVEFPSKDINVTKVFFETVFGWKFKDYGPEYTAFSNAGMNGGFYKADLASTVDNGSALIVFYSNNLESTQAKVEGARGKIVKSIFG